MRAVLFVLIIIVLAVIVAIATGLLDINQIRGGKAPHVSASGNGISAEGGQPPAFDVETGSVKLGSKQTNVKVPTLVVQKPSQNQSAATTNNAM
jgi:hypothetical protein